MTAPNTRAIKTQYGSSKPLRAFSLLELGVVVAIAGIVASLGMAGMRELVIAERGRNAAVKFSTDLRRMRSEAAQRKMHTYVEMNTVGGATRVTFRAKRLGTGTETPCELMQTGAADIVRTHAYESVGVNLTETDPATGGTSTSTSMCFTQFGAPRTLDMTEARALALDLRTAGVGGGAASALTMQIDTSGAILSSDSAASSGIAATGLHPQDLMWMESAPVPPGAFDVPAVTFYETDPGIYIEAGGDAGDGSTGISPCDPMYGMCGSECITTVCAAPCDACYSPCSDSAYASTYPCECYGATSCECDAAYCPCDPLVTICCTTPTIDTDGDGVADSC